MLLGFARTIGACRGGNNPERNAGMTFYRRLSHDVCRGRCAIDSSCTGYTISASGRGSWCETYTSVGATGDGRSSYHCWMQGNLRQKYHFYHIILSFSSHYNS